MAVTLNLPPETEKYLREKAARSGQTLEDYLCWLAERDTQSANGSAKTATADQVSPEEFDRRLDALNEGLPSLPALPADWSRADLHADHA
jgi:hypothetical protein